MSSVPKYRRNKSKVEFINTFYKIRKEVILILARDFGIKQRTYSIDLIEDIYSLSEDDRAELEEIMLKYGINSAIVDKYPDWLINGWRNELMGIMNNMGIEIFCANSIYITNIQEYYNRRMHWNAAIGYCMALQDKLQEIIDCVKGIKLGQYQVVQKMLLTEVKLLKGVRKSDNKVLKGLNEQLPFFYNAFTYNNYPAYPFVPNYCNNNNSVDKIRLKEMCVIAEHAPAPEVQPNKEMKVMCKIVA